MTLILSQEQDIEKLINQVKITLSDEVYFELKNFYRDIFESSFQYDQIMFLVRRGLIMAEIFYHICCSEDDKNEDIKNSYYKFCTDSTLLSRCTEFSRNVIDGYMPRILIVDEVIIQGASLNELLSKFENKIVSLVKDSETNESSMDEDKIRNIILNSISIRVFAQSSAIMFLNPKYQFKFSKMKILNNKNYYDFSNRVSILIKELKLINATFIMGGTKEKEKDFYINDKFKRYDVVSKDLVEHIYFYKETISKYIATVRIIEHTNWDNTILPFIFLPKLNEISYARLVQEIKQRWWPDEWLGGIKANTKVEFEMVSMFLSMSLLKIFDSKLFSKKDSLDDFKIAINYGFNKFEENSNCLNLLKSGECLFNKIELFSLLDEVCQESESFLPCNLIFNSEDIINEESVILKTIEEIIYYQKIDQMSEYPKEFEEITLKNNPNKISRDISLQSFIRDCHENTLSISNGTCCIEMICWILKLLDSGIITLKADIDNYCQTIRAGELSTFILPKRYYILMSTFSYIKNKYGYDDNILKTQISSLIQDLRFENTDLFENLENDLFRFFKALDRSGQNIDDWNFNLFIYGINK